MSDLANGTQPDLTEALSKAYDEMMNPAPEREAPSTLDKPEVTEEGTEIKAEDVKPEDAKQDEVKADDAKPEEPKPVANIKAPTAWTASMREKFGDLPEDVRSEIVRREKDMEQFVHKTAVERQVAQNFQHVVTPYMEHLKQMGVSPYDAVGSLLQLGQKLTTGDKKAKAEVLGELFSNYDVDLDALNDVLIERMKGPQKSATEKELMQKLDAIERRITTPAPRPNEAVATPDVNRAIEDFAKDPKNEFFTDVSQDMALLLQSGKASDLKDAYDKACRMNDDVFKVMQQREAQAKARVQNANVSLKGGTPKVTAKPANHQSTADFLSKAFDEMMGQ